MDAILAAAPHWFTYPGKHEVAFQLWHLSIRWYGLSYLFGAILVYLQLQSRPSRERTGMTVDQAQEFVVYAMIGVILGGRALFIIADILTPVAKGGHPLDYYLHDPLEFISIWHGGMAFHGGFLGALVGMWLFVRRNGLSFMRVADETALWIPLAIAVTRVTNFFNGELPGRTTDAPIGFLFPDFPPYRYPSQLFECVGMLVVVLPFVWLLHGWSRRRDGLVFWAFIASYGAVRTVVEFYREPGIMLFGLTAAQYLTLAMLIIGAIMMWRVQQETPLAPRTTASGKLVSRSKS